VPRDTQERKWNDDTRVLDLQYVRRNLPHLSVPMLPQARRHQDNPKGYQDEETFESACSDSIAEFIRELLRTGGHPEYIRTFQTCGAQLYNQQHHTIQSILNTTHVQEMPTFVFHADNCSDTDIDIAMRRAGIRRPNVLIVDRPNPRLIETIMKVYTENAEYFGIIIICTNVASDIFASEMLPEIDFHLC
jgi:hypothetical protein